MNSPITSQILEQGITSKYSIVNYYSCRQWLIEIRWTAEPWSNDAVLYQPYEVEQILLAENASCLSAKAFLKVSISSINYQLSHNTKCPLPIDRCASLSSQWSLVQMLNTCHRAVIWQNCLFYNAVHLSSPSWSPSSIWWRRRGSHWHISWMPMKRTTCARISVWPKKYSRTLRLVDSQKQIVFERKHCHKPCIRVFCSSTALYQLDRYNDTKWNNLQEIRLCLSVATESYPVLAKATKRSQQIENIWLGKLYQRSSTEESGEMLCYTVREAGEESIFLWR